MVLGMTAPTEERPASAGVGWIPDESTFAARLMAVRRHKGWGNVSEAARACGLPPENWRLWEQGRIPSRLVTIGMVIAGNSGCDFLWLVHGPGRGGAGEANARYPQTLADLMDDRPSAALRPRVVARVGHGDGRRRPQRVRSEKATTVSKSRPVSRVALAER